ncbi:MAG: hypothetical protein K0U98_01055 [Deltaproteobacteria bacterium]|nr:hypothetical protein [Deltaproteobacteria bacterium]
MVEILLYLATHCGFLFRPGGFRLVDSRVDQSSGGDAFVRLESESTRLCFTLDRGQLLLSFQGVGGDPKEWFSLGLLRGVLTGHRGGSEVLDAAWAEFLESSLEELERRFSHPELTQDTVKSLEKQGRLRAKELFG